MRLDELAMSLSKSERFSATVDQDLLLVRNLETESDYIVENFDGSLQVRQAVHFDCFEMTSEELSSIYILCSKVNERFSGCKSFIDRWGVLITASDIISIAASVELVEALLNQVEFISQCMVGLVEIARTQCNELSDETVDAALAAPSLQ